VVASPQSATHGLQSLPLTAHSQDAERLDRVKDSLLAYPSASSAASSVFPLGDTTRSQGRQPAENRKPTDDAAELADHYMDQL